METNFLTVKEVAEKLKCEINVVYKHIEAKQLPAFDIARPGSTRHTWRVSTEMLKIFIDGKSNQSIIPAAPRRKRKKRDYKRWV